MNKQERQKFRHSNRWKEFKAKIRLHCSRDYITKKPLDANWNLHHLDLNTKRYDQLDDMNRFMPLNKRTHEIIHDLFKWYTKDHNVLKRIEKTLKQMEEFTNE